jgi:hypothetical protein
MYSRLNQLFRQVSRQVPTHSHTSASVSQGACGGGLMASFREEKGKRLIHTAGCIIIGDEVLGGKVYSKV